MNASDQDRAELRMNEFENLQKVIGQNTVIDIPALKVDRGEICALGCPTNSGKRALPDILIGQTRPTAGAITLNQIEPLQNRG